MNARTNKNGSGSVKVVVASASAVRRAGLEAVVRSILGLKLAGTFASLEQIPHSSGQLELDVLLADLLSDASLPRSGILSFPAVALIDDPTPAWTALALRSNVRAILPRDASTEQIQSAILAAHSGLVMLSAAVGLSLAERIQPSFHSGVTPIQDLTQRELEVLAMMADGLGNREIAERLGVSDHTIKFHISSILDKLDASTRTEAVTTGLRMGLILL
jgi:two-component system, NarL family, response regulator YdfI